MAKIIWTEKATGHLRAIFDYISEDSPLYAERFIRALVTSAAKLEGMPSCGRIVPEFYDQNIREVVFRNYRIVYTLNKLPSLPIIAVIHGARDFSAHVFEEWELS